MGKGRRAGLTAWVGGALLAVAIGGPARAEELVVVQANVGNVNVPGCGEQVFKLCLRPVEQRAAGALRALGADLVALEEVLPPSLCTRAPSGNPANLCSGMPAPPSQVARLLGDAYRHACDDRFGWDCLAARSARLELHGPATRPVQPSCEDAGFTLNTATVRLRGWPMTAAVAHPSSTDVPCRARQLADFFASLRRGPAIVLGDFNLDPFREADESVGEWRRWVPSSFQLVSGAGLTSFPCGSSQLDPTGATLDLALEPCAGPLSARTIDHVLARGATGSCEVRRVDGGGGMDHRAQVCRITAGDTVTPAVRLRSRGCLVQALFRPHPSHLVGVRFRIGGRTVTDRRAPYRVARRGRERGRRVRVTARPLLANGHGPLLRRALARC